VHELDPLLAGGPGERDAQGVGVEAEGDVDRVRPEEEGGLVRDERQMDAVAEPVLEQKSGFEAGEAASEDDDAWGAHGGPPWELVT
jgi:hypothetical protein